MGVTRAAGDGLDVGVAAVVTHAPASRALHLAVFLFAILFVSSFDGMWSGKRYAYAADSASYIEMADSLYQQGHPRVTPWDYAEGSADQIPQRLFPPGYPLLVAAFIPVTGSARTAALLPGRLAAILMPVVLLALFAGALNARVLALLSMYVLLTPGVRGWQYLAYSDVSALLVSVLALGALARGLGLLASTRRPLLWCCLAGLAAGCAYGIRNAGIAVLAITAVMLMESLWRRWAWREALAVSAGIVPPLGALLLYNLRTFGQLQPYAMPPSQRAWFLNVVDWARASFTDAGVPWQVAEPLPHWIAPCVLAVALLVIATGFWKLHGDPRRRALLLLLGGYAAGGALLLIASRSRYEWGNTIDERNTLQYTWALAFALTLSVPIVFGAQWVARFGRAALAFMLLMFGMSVYDAWVVGTAPTEWWQELAADTQVINAARAPNIGFQASNQAVLFRIGAGQPVRNVEIGGDDRDLWRALSELRQHAAGRSAQFLLVCDQYTSGYSACGGEGVTGVPAPLCQLVREPSPRVVVCPVSADKNLTP